MKDTDVDVLLRTTTGSFEEDDLLAVTFSTTLNDLPRIRQTCFCFALNWILKLNSELLMSQIMKKCLLVLVL